MNKSWKTTVTGLLTIVVVLAGAVKAYLTGVAIDYPTVISAITAGVGLITARDNNVTSEQAGAKPSA